MNKIFIPLFMLGLFFVCLYLALETGLSLNNGLGGWMILMFIFCVLVAFVISDSRNQIRPIAILLMAGLTVSAIYIINKDLLSDVITNNIETIIKLNGFWTFFAVIISAPTLFIVWHFRDVNNAQEIENQRKDVNLKEVQKIAEWVGGVHINNNDDNYETEDFLKRSNFDTYDKHNGAIALQIASIYSLEPFLQGKYGDTFKNPTLNLIKSSWQALLQHDLDKLNLYLKEEEGIISNKNCIKEQEDKIKKLEEINKNKENIIKLIRKKSHSPIGRAITQVLLLNILDFPNIFPSLFLSGMDFYSYGIKRDLHKKIFCIRRNCSKMELDVTNLCKTTFKRLNLKESSFNYSNLNNSIFISSDLESSKFIHTQVKKGNFKKNNLTNTNFTKANLSKSIFYKSIFNSTVFYNADLSSIHIKQNNFFASKQRGKINYCIFKNANLQSSIISNIDFLCSDFSNANLSGCELYNSYFECCEFPNAVFRNANMDDIKIVGSDLIRANFIGAKLDIEPILLTNKVKNSIIDIRDSFTEELISKLKEHSVFLVKEKQVFKIEEITAFSKIIFIHKTTRANVEHSISGFNIDIIETKKIKS